MDVRQKLLKQKNNKAIGKSKGFAESDKKAFAHNLVAELDITDNLVKQLSVQKESHKRLHKILTKTEINLSELCKEVAKNFDTTNIYVLAIEEMKSVFKLYN